MPSNGLGRQMNKEKQGWLVPRIFTKEALSQKLRRSWNCHVMSS